jgi:hypothetical protein
MLVFEGEREYHASLFSRLPLYNVDVTSARQGRDARGRGRRRVLGEDTFTAWSSTTATIVQLWLPLFNHGYDCSSVVTIVQA